MPLAPANQAQLIRSSQKDEYYRTVLRNNANETFQTLGGSRRWLDWRREIELLSDLCYYALTTLSGFQTLGEEYVGVVQVSPVQVGVAKVGVASRARRGFSVLGHALLPYLLEKLLVCLENELGGGGVAPGGGGVAPGGWGLEAWLRAGGRRAAGGLSEAQRRRWGGAAGALREALQLLHRLHTAMFYLTGAFYHLSKRAAAISYVRVGGPGGGDSSIRTSYRLLGAVSLLQLLATAALLVSRHRGRHHSPQTVVPPPQTVVAPPRAEAQAPPQDRPHPPPAGGRCSLCLEPRRGGTCTPCGHLFCWDCISQWSSSKAECPLCRERFPPHRLVLLRNSV